MALTDISWKANAHRSLYETPKVKINQKEGMGRVIAKEEMDRSVFKVNACIRDDR